MKGFRIILYSALSVFIAVLLLSRFRMNSAAYEPEPTAVPVALEMSPSPAPTSTPAPTPTPELKTASSFYSEYETPPCIPNTEGCTQMVYIKPDAGGTSMLYYEFDDSRWNLICICSASIGENGVSKEKKEGDGCTPAGEYPLLFVMAINEPITELNCKKLNSTSVFVTDTKSKYYNTLQDRYVSDGDFDTYELIYETYFKGGTHKNMIYIGYNGDGLTPGSAVAGKGSMITLCGKTESLKPTGGCIDIYDTDMTKLLRYLDAGRNPVIIIGDNENNAIENSSGQ